MTLDFFIAQLLNGLSHATTLFLMAAGLGLIFGVTRIVNFAHGSFYMFGAYFAAHLVTNWLPAWGESAVLYGLAMLAAIGLSALAGVVFERLVLRRMVGAPELYALVATFGLSLVLHDLMRFGFGVNEVFAPRFPGLKGAVEIAGSPFPAYHLASIAIGPLVWLGLWALLSKTAFGARLRAATQDAGMVAALGVNPKPLMMGAVALGCALAGLGGALSVPVSPVNLQMDLQIIVETFVVVVTGGLGSISGAFLAALLIGVVHAFGLALVPQASLVLVFGVMALVLLVKPHGLFGKAQAMGSAQASIDKFFAASNRTLFVTAIGLYALWLLALRAGDYWMSVLVDALILLIFAMSLQLAMGLGGLVSFGHAAFFGLGAYGAALMGALGHWNAFSSIAIGLVAALFVALVFGWVVIRTQGVYLAMLSLALAQLLWAGATQWVDVTGGDNGVIGLSWLADAPDWQKSALEFALVGLTVILLFAMQKLTQSRMGWRLQAMRDAPIRAAASGLNVALLRYLVYVVSAVLAALAGAAMVVYKGAVFPSSLSVATSLDALLAILLGGLHQGLSALVGSFAMTFLSSELGRLFDYWRGLLGLVVLLLMMFSPRGLIQSRGPS
jgi:branched-chain amino acid transport system permease protein